MTEYIIMVRILGGEWQRYQVSEEDFSTNDLAEALGQRATILDPIREAMVVRIDTSWEKTEHGLLTTKWFDLVE